MNAQLAPDRRVGRRALRRAVVLAIVSATVAGTAAAFDPTESHIIVQLELALVGVILVMAAAGALRRTSPLAPRSPLDRAPQSAPPARRPLPVDLVRMSRRLAASEGSAADARRHLAPVVAAIAADKLRHGSHVTVEADSVYAHLPRPVPDALALVLDPALADLDTRALPGLDPDAIEALVRALEQLTATPIRGSSAAPSRAKMRPETLEQLTATPARGAVQ